MLEYLLHSLAEGLNAGHGNDRDERHYDGVLDHGLTRLTRELPA